jgi:Phosphatidylinositol-4-phosphate 5-Kinase
LPRPSEYSFFKEDLLLPYHEHMRAHPDSLLVRITDFLHSKYVAVGSILGFAPSHHIIMENILYGKGGDTLADKWETYDLKPIDYFYPERDLAGGALASDSVKERLVDKFEDKIRVTEQQREDLLTILAEDTRLLESTNVVDYSLFLVRYPAVTFDHGVERNIEMLASKSSPWRTGVTSTDKKWVYRAIVLDFFWAKHKLQAMAMTGLIKSFNLIGRKGPMSITTDAKEYRTRFMGMVESIVEVESLV